jgi:hypothetical protein
MAWWSRSTVGRWATFALVLVTTMVGCAPTNQPARSTEGGQTSAPVDRKPKVLTIAEDSEPQIVVTGMGCINRPPAFSAPHPATFDNRGEVPQLVWSCPRRRRGCGSFGPMGPCRPAGLRRNVTWHDGTPLTARMCSPGRCVWTRAPSRAEVARQIARTTRR